MRGTEPGAAGRRRPGESECGDAGSSTPSGCGTQAAADPATIEAARAALGLKPAAEISAAEADALIAGWQRRRGPAAPVRGAAGAPAPIRDRGLDAETIAKALGRAQRVSGGWIASCPVPSHGRGKGDRHPSLSIADAAEPGRVLLRCHAACDQAAVLDALRRRGLWGGGGYDRPAAPAPAPAPGGDWAADFLRPPSEAEKRRLAALEIWKASLPAAGTLVESYLAARGLALPAGCNGLRFAPSLKHPAGGRWPAMVAAVRDADAGFLGVHRTFLARDGSGKARIFPPKMSLGPIAGGAVRLAPAGERLVVGEGIESLIGAMRASGLPGWAALSTSGLRSLRLPADVREIIIAADGDAPGETAAVAAARRWAAEGRAVRIAETPAGADFGDA